MFSRVKSTFLVGRTVPSGTARTRSGNLPPCSRRMYSQPRFHDLFQYFGYKPNRMVCKSGCSYRLHAALFFFIGTKKNFSNTIENKVKLQGIRSGVVGLVDDPLTDSLKLVAQEIQMTGNRTFPVKDVGAAEMFAEQSLRRVDHLLRENLDHSNNNIKTT